MVEHLGSSNWRDILPIVASAGANVEIAVSVRVVGTEDRFDVNSTAPLPAASTIKTAILVALYRAVDAGHIDLDTTVLIDPAAKVPGSGVLTWLHDGLALTIADLAYLMIAISDNTASNLLLDTIGLEQVRATINDLGLSATALNRRFLGRVPGPTEPDNVTSAADLTALLTAIATDEATSAPSCAKMRDLLNRQQHRDRLARSLPPTVTFGGKSGSLPNIVHDSGLIAGPGGTLAITVLTQGFPNPYAAEHLIGRIARTAVAAAGIHERMSASNRSAPSRLHAGPSVSS